MKKSIEMAKFLDGIDKLILEKKYHQAERFLKNYINQNKINCYPVLRKLGHVLRINGKQEEAIEILLPLLDTSEKLKVYYELAYDYADLGKYDISLKYINLLLQHTNGRNEDFVKEIKVLQLFVKSIINNEKIDNSIANTLLFNYSKEKAIKHIVVSHGYESNKKIGRFYENIDLIELFEKVQQEIKSRNDLIFKKSHLRRLYYFDYKNIGIDYNGKNTDVLIVVTNDDKNIVTMYPDLNNLNTENLNHLNFLIETKYQLRKSIERKSQIDKFYEKYGKIN